MPLISSIRKTMIIKNEATNIIAEKRGIKSFSSFKSIYILPDINKLIKIAIPPVKGVGLL